MLKVFLIYHQDFRHHLTKKKKDIIGHMLLWEPNRSRINSTPSMCSSRQPVNHLGQQTDDGDDYVYFCRLLVVFTFHYISSSLLVIMILTYFTFISTFFFVSCSPTFVCTISLRMVSFPRTDNLANRQT